MAPHDHDMDHRREHSVSRLLRAGIIASGVFLLLGFVLYAAQPRWYDITDPTGMWHSLMKGEDLSPLNPFIHLYLGLFFLMLTPIARVGMTAWMFARERDTRYTIISLIVLFVLLGSIGLSLFSH
jgi:uncharacterized membrane protein